MLDTLLKDLGLREQEARIYQLLLEDGPMLAGHMSKRLGVPRASLYGFLAQLVKGGFISQALTSSGVKTFDAEPMSKLLLILDQQMDQMKNRRRDVETFLSSAQGEKAGRRARPRFQLFEGADGVRNILKDLLLYRNMESQAFWPAKIMTDTLSPELFAHFNQERIKNNFWIRAIWPTDQAPDLCITPFLGTGKAFKREIRVAPKEVSFSMGYWIYGDRVAFVSSYKEAVGFIIESHELAETLRASFEFVWQASKSLVPSKKEKAAMDGFLRSIGVKPD